METSYLQIIGQVVRSQRAMKGTALVTMAKAAGLSSPSGWSRIETGDTTMTVGQLRKAARTLEMEPWVLVQQADTIAGQLEASGVKVHDDKPKKLEKWLLGGAALLAVVAAAAATKPKKNE